MIESTWIPSSSSATPLTFRQPGPARSGAVVIGASAGAVEALLYLLPQLGPEFPLPIIVVVHLPADRPNTLVDLFASRCRLPVKEAEDKEEPVGGTVYFAPPDYHLQVEPDFRLSLSSDEPVHFSRPAIDVLFESAADAWGDALTGIILTGANSDGAAGLRRVELCGGTALVQHPDSAVAVAMPRAALQSCERAEALTLNDILSFLKSKIPISHFRD